MNKELEKKVKLKSLAIQAANFYVDLFYEQDNDYIDGRKISNIDRAIERRIKKITELTDAPADRVRSLMHYDPLRTWSKYFDSLRAIGVPIATQEEVKEFDNKK